jgi:hypothetical protein
MDFQSWISRLQTPSYIGIVIILVIVLVFYFAPSYGRKILVTAEGPFSLESQQTIISDQASKAYYSDSNGSFSCFVYLSPMNRTGTYSTCGANPNQASCADGTFAPCQCDATSGDCAKCNHLGYNQVFSIAGIVGLEVLNAPDASRQGKAMAQLIIKTEGAPLSAGASASQKYIETLVLPPISLQKWMMVSIAREGRRFDVYFNDRIVLSQKTMFMPISNISNTNFRGITSGSNGLVGNIALANVYNYRLSSQVVFAKYKEFADTRGRPYINSTANPVNTSENPNSIKDAAGLTPTFLSGYSLGSFVPDIKICPPEGCLSTPAIQPASPLYDWSS